MQTFFDTAASKELIPFGCPQGFVLGFFCAPECANNCAQIGCNMNEEIESMQTWMPKCKWKLICMQVTYVCVCVCVYKYVSFRVCECGLNFHRQTRAWHGLHNKKVESMRINDFAWTVNKYNINKHTNTHTHTHS